MIQANDVLSGKVPILGGNAAIIGGGMVGIETAEYVLHHSRGAAKSSSYRDDRQHRSGNGSE